MNPLKRWYWLYNFSVTVLSLFVLFSSIVFRAPWYQLLVVMLAGFGSLDSGRCHRCKRSYFDWRIHQ